jgi:hypothetical protein
MAVRWFCINKCMKYLIYKTTNKLDGKYYIGCHCTENENDDYLGSGKHLTSAIKKYGRQNFVKQILYILENKQDMFNKERELVNEDLVNDPLSYNLKIGGSGGNPGIIGAFKGKTHSAATIEKIKNAALKQITTDQKRQKLSQNNWAKKDPASHKEHVIKINKNIPKSESHKEKLREINLGKKHDIISCPHCGKEGGARAMKRWHFSNCKDITP